MPPVLFGISRAFPQFMKNEALMGKNRTIALNGTFSFFPFCFSPPAD